MTDVTGTRMRIGLVVLVATVFTMGVCEDAVARVHKRHLHTHVVKAESHPQLVSQQPVRLAPMRYYGGPKSPMWRG